MDPRTFVVLIAAIAATAALSANFDNCSDSCTVTEVRVDPCRSKKKCRLTKGSNATISFDFTPNFSATELQTSVYSDITNDKLETIGNKGVEDACLHTSCPVEAGKSQTFDFKLYIGKKFPKGNFVLKWLVWNKEKEKEEFCCLKTVIAL